VLLQMESGGSCARPQAVLKVLGRAAVKQATYALVSVSYSHSRGS
jgi:hypothetical protein